MNTGDSPAGPSEIHGILRTLRVYCRQGGALPLPRPELRCVFSRNSGSLTSDVPPSQTTRWRAVVRVLRSPVDALSCALLPASCALCGSPLSHLSSVPICDACWAEFSRQSGSVCLCCGDALDAPVSHQTGKSLCRVCRLAPPPFVRAIAYGPYQGRMKAAIHALKYGRLQPAARRLGKMLAEAIAQLAEETPAEMLVVPVPLHCSKYAQRGFNQARTLAAYALEALRESHPAWRLTLAPSTLMRQRATESQAGLTARQRRLNVRGAFSVSDPAIVDQKHILIIDDIYTSGATTHAAALALVRAGAASVWVAILARAVRSNPVRRGSNLFFEDVQGDCGSPSDERLSQLFVSDKVLHPSVRKNAPGWGTGLKELGEGFRRTATV